jgi:hypothetical protein
MVPSFLIYSSPSVFGGGRREKSCLVVFDEVLRYESLDHSSLVELLSLHELEKRTTRASFTRA